MEMEVIGCTFIPCISNNRSAVYQAQEMDRNKYLVAGLTLAVQSPMVKKFLGKNGLRCNE